MYIITIALVISLTHVPCSSRPSLKLSFDPVKTYFSHYEYVDIRCQIEDPNENNNDPQLWHVDITNNKTTLISRQLFREPPPDAPNVFRYDQEKRYEFFGKGSIRITSLRMEDSAYYMCNCPNCEELIEKQVQELYVMKIVEPQLIFEPGWPLHENARALARCFANDFYPHVGHRITHHHKEITSIGRSSSSGKTDMPHQFTWEAEIIPTADWHNTIFTCTVTEGNDERSVSRTLEVLFDPRFSDCNEKQSVDTNRNISTIECMYRGHPEPQVEWYYKSDGRPVIIENGIDIRVSQHNNSFKSEIIFDQRRILQKPGANITEENYFQKIFQGGFAIKLLSAGVVKESKTIHVKYSKKYADGKSFNNANKFLLSPILSLLLFIRYIN